MHHFPVISSVEYIHECSSNSIFIKQRISHHTTTPALTTQLTNQLTNLRADKDLSDRNVYCDPYTAELLPLDGDFEGGEVRYESVLCGVVLCGVVVVVVWWWW